jgi:hypothetical protein
MPARLGQIHLGDEQGTVAHLERDVRERLRGRDDGGAVTARAVGAQRLGKRLAERAAGGADLFARVTGRNLEREVERRVLGEQLQQMIEHGDARGDVRHALAGDGDAHLGARFGFAMRGSHDASERTPRVSSFERWAERPMPISTNRIRFGTG